MSEIVVAVPTFHRPESLSALLTVVVEQARSIPARVLLVDNDPGGSARDVAEAFGVDHVIEPARGLAAVRNRALSESADEAALVFIDDDEIPADGWLDTLVQVWRESKADAVSGRVETVFPDDFTDEWISAGGFFRRVRFADGARQAAAPTNNLLLDLNSVRRYGLRFEEEFGLSGGEDILFTKQLVRAGGIIVSCPDALVYDTVSRDRLTRRWVLRRAYRVGVTASATEVWLSGGLTARCKGVLGGGARLLAGGARWLAGEALRSSHHSARGARAAWRGAGMVMGALGQNYQEYALR